MSQSPKKRVLSRVWPLLKDISKIDSLNPLKSGSYPEMMILTKMNLMLKCLNPLKSGSYPELH